MKTPKYLSRFLIPFFIYSSLFTLEGANAVVTPPLTRCNIEVGDAHISSNLLRTRGLIAVKVNARSKCNKPMRNLVLTVEIYKVGLLKDHKVSVNTVVISGLVYANQVIKNQKTFIKCRNNKDSKYFGVAYSAALIEGKAMKTLSVRSENIVSLQCGN